MNARRRDFLRPQVESLEPRRLLACEVFVRDRTLFIIGDEADNRIEIVADDLGVQVNCDGEPQTFSASEAMRLFVDTGDADDTLDIRVHPGGQLSQFEIHAGAGVDNVHVRLPAENAGVAIHAAIGAAGLSDIQLDHPPPEEPITAARFELSIDGHEFAVFQELQGLDTEVESVEYLSSEDQETILVKLSDDENILGIKLSGLWSTLSSVTLEADKPMDQVVIVDEAGHSADMTFHVNLGDGDDIVSVLRNPLLYPASPAKSGYQFNLGPGNDRFQWSAGGASGASGESYTFSRGEPEHSIDIDVADLDTAAPPTSIHLEGAEAVIVKAGDGDDRFDVASGIAAALHLFGQGGDDQAVVVGGGNAGNAGSDLYDFDGGWGHDEFQLITTDVAERIEIHGMPDREVPDPLIRVTDLDTGLVTGEFRVVGAEIITADAAGGDDAVLLSDADGPLTGIDWTIITGDGADITQVRLGDNEPPRPQDRSFFHFNYFAGAGDDTFFNLVDDAFFFDVPAELSYEIDMGDGDNAATVQFGDGEPGHIPPTGEGHIHVTYRSGAGNDSMVAAFFDVVFDVTLTIAAGEGNNVIDTRWTGPTLIPDAPCQIVGIDTGDGSDAVTFMADGDWEELEANIVTGGGEDMVNVGISNPAPAAGGSEPEEPGEFRRRTAVSLRTGDRDDTAIVNFQGGCNSVLDVLLDMGLGDDDLAVNLMLKCQLKTDGDGDGLLDLGPVLLKLHTNLDDGDDTAAVRVNNLANLEALLNIMGGAGDDDIAIESIEIAHEGFELPSSSYDVLVDLGAGDDLFGLAGAALPSESIDLDAAKIVGGDGMDTFNITASPFDDLTLDGGEDADATTIQFGHLAGPVRVVDKGTPGLDKLKLLGTAFDERIDVMRGPAGGESWIVKWEGPDFDAGTSQLAIETIEIAHEGLFLGVDAGEGDDGFGITGTQARELFEILGVPDQGLPDPRIRVTPLTNGQIPAEFLVVNAEAIAVDSAGGDDQVDMREIDAPLSGIDWTILTGAGHDTVAARLAAIPDVLHVSAGQGNDDVSLVFADNPNIPPVPREPNAKVPEIVVDVGAGVDSVLLDVYGSLLLASPSDIAPQITLEEVLAAIQIQGVGLLALLTLFPLGALDMAQSIKDDRAGHVKSEAAIALAGANLAVDLTTGATSDSVLVDLAPLPGSRIDLDLNTGGGDDHIKIHSTSPIGTLDWTLNVGPGGGEDEVLVAFEHGDVHHPMVIGGLWNDKDTPSQSPSSGGRLSLTAKGQGDEFVVDFDLAGALGPDDLQFDALFPTDLRRVVADIDIATGLGDDAIDVNLESAAESVEQKVRIDGGAGDDRVSVNLPAVQTDGSADLIVGADAGAGPHVKVFDGGNGAEVQSFLAYNPSFPGGVRVAAGDVNGDGVADIITAAGAGALPHVKVFDGRSGGELRSFLAYGAGFSGGVYVAAGDVNGDGFDDIITGAGAGATHVKVFDGRNGAEIRSFLAYSGFASGVRVAAGDVNGDDFDDIVTGVGPGAPPHVKVFDGHSGAEIRSFLAYGGFAGGVFVAAGDVDGDGRADIVTGTDAGAAGGHVKAFSGATGAELRSFFAFDPSFAGGVRVAAGDVNGDGFADIVAGAGPGAGPHVKVFDGQTNAEIKSFFAFDPNFAGGDFVASGDLHSAPQPERLDLDLAIDTAAGADVVEVQLGATATEELLQKVRISTGDGADRASVIWRKLRLKTEFPNAVAADLNIDTGAGDDRAEVELQAGGAADNIYSFKLEMGAGNDLARYWVFGTELPPAGARQGNDQFLGRFSFEVLGGLGSDDIQGRIGTNRVGQLMPVPLGQALIEMDGGGGNDRLSLDFRGAILDAAAVDAVLRGGKGNDQVRARFDLDPRSNGKLSAQVLGDAGNDELGLAVLNADDLDVLFALLDGGTGRDRCRTTRNVIVKNCP